MAFVKISEQSSLYDDLEKKSVHELLVDINTEDKKVALAVEKALPQIEELVTRIVPRMKKGGRVFYMGAGTSGRLGVLDASELPPTFGVPATYVYGLIAGGDYALRNAVENAEDDPEKGWKELQEHNINENDTVIGIAASGTTPYVIGALHTAREHGILTGAHGCRERCGHRDRSGSRIRHRQLTHEVRHGTENGPQHDFRLTHDSARAC